ncbi:MAG: cytochrome c oxidase subunit II [Candidatus Cyclobacteriaceae bacterium M3_2C_046]
MLQAFIVIGIIFILAILLLLFRIIRLVSVVKGKHKTSSAEQITSSNKVNGLLLLLFMIFGLGAFFWYSTKNFDVYNLPVASEHGILTDRLFWVTMAITGFVFVLTNVLLFYFSYKYQYKKDQKALYYPDNSKLEIIWTIVPAIVLSLLVFAGLKTWNQVMDQAPDDAEVVEILGYQFAWNVRYPGMDDRLGDYHYQLIDVENTFGIDFTDRASFDDFIPREIHLPVGKPVLFKIRARDVLHSVFAPHFRLKMDAVPGMPTKFWFIPNKTTDEMRQELNNPDFNYEIACTEVCGRGHFSMKITVVVEEPEAYEQWYAEQESWLSKHPDYLAKVPENLKELAMSKTGIKYSQDNEKLQSETSAIKN